MNNKKEVTCVITQEIVDSTNFTNSPCYAQMAIINEGFTKKEASRIYNEQIYGIFENKMKSSCGNEDFQQDLMALDKDLGTEYLNLPKLPLKFTVLVTFLLLFFCTGTLKAQINPDGSFLSNGKAPVFVTN